MADLMQALREADARGDTRAAQRFAQMIKEQQTVTPEEAKKQELLSVNTKELSQKILEARKAGDEQAVLDLNQLAFEARKAQAEEAGLSEDATLNIAGFDTGIKTGGFEAPLVAAGRTMTNVGRMIGAVDEEAPEVTARYDKLKEHYPVATLAGEAAPAAPLGAMAAGLKTKARQVLGTMGAGALEGAAVSDEENRGMGAGVGLLAPLITEYGLPYATRAVGAVYKRITGKAPKVPALKPNGALSDEIQAAVDSGEVGIKELTEELGAAAQKGKTSKIASVIDEAPLDEQALKAAQELGVVDDLTPGMLSKSQRLQELETSLANVGTVLGEQRAQAIKQLGQKADDLITTHGGSLEKMTVSDEILGDVESTISGMRGSAREIYDELGSKIPPRTKVDMRPLREHLVLKARDLGGIDNLDPLEKKLLNMTKSKRGVTHALLDKERKEIGEKLRAAKKGTPYGDASTYTLGELEDILNSVQGKAAQDIGGDDLLDLWKSGKSVVAQRKGLEEKAINVFGKERTKAIIPELGKGIKSLSRGDARAFDKVMSAIPEDRRQEAILTAMNDVFTGGARNQSQLNMGGFAAWHEKLKRDKTAYKKLTQYLGSEPVKFMDNLATLSGKVNTAISRKPQTGIVAPTLAQFDQKGGLVDKLLNIGDKYTGGSYISNAFKADESTLEKATQLLASPEFKRMMIVGAKDRTSEAAKNVESAVMRSKAFKEWANSLPQKTRASALSIGAIPYFVEEADKEDGE